MMIRVEERITVDEFLTAMKRRYGTLSRFRAHVRSHPSDVTAKLDLEDYEFFVRRPEMRPETMEKAVALIPVSDAALSAFTRQRLALLDALAEGSFASVRDLARRLGRDVHNVHADLQLFRRLGLVAFERGPGRRRVPRLVGNAVRIDVGVSAGGVRLPPARVRR